MRQYKAHPAHDRAAPRADAKPKAVLDTENGPAQASRMNNGLKLIVARSGPPSR